VYIGSTGDRRISELMNKKLSIKKGNIYGVISLSLCPFFIKEIEDKFYELRLSEEWGEFVGYDSMMNQKSNELEKRGKLKKRVKDYNKSFKHDEHERSLEKNGLKMEAFRGIAYEELLTPIYKLNKEKFNTSKIPVIIQKQVNEILLDCWKIKIKLTKEGLATLFFEKEISKEYDIEHYISKTRKLLSIDVDGEELESPLGNSAIQIAYSFLQEYEVDKKIAKILKKEKCCENDSENYLKKDRKNIRYESFISFVPGIPPARNYFIAYHFKGVEGKENGCGVPIRLEDHFNCPGEPHRCKKKMKGECFIVKFGNELLSLSTNLYRDTKKHFTFTQKQIEELAKRNQSRCSGELCLVESESTIICTQENSETIYVAGQPIDYNDYWKCIIKGFSLMIECKTLAMIIGRLLYDCAWHHRNQGKDGIKRSENGQGDNQKEVKFKIKDIEDIRKELSVISNLLSRTRMTATPSNIARATYFRDKLEAFTKALGLQEIIKNIEEDYDNVNRSISSSIDARRNEIIQGMTIILIGLGLIPVILHIWGDKLKGIQGNWKWGGKGVLIFEGFLLFYGIYKSSNRFKKFVHEFLKILKILIDP